MDRRRSCGPGPGAGQTSGFFVAGTMRSRCPGRPTTSARGTVRPGSPLEPRGAGRHPRGLYVSVEPQAEGRDVPVPGHPLGIRAGCSSARRRSYSRRLRGVLASTCRRASACIAGRSTVSDGGVRIVNGVQPVVVRLLARRRARWTGRRVAIDDERRRQRGLRGGGSGGCFVERTVSTTLPGRRSRRRRSAEGPRQASSFRLRSSALEGASLA